MIPRYQLFRERIATEWRQIRRAAEKAENAFRNAATGGQNESFYLDSAALNLHGFYNGLERLFESLAHDLDDGVPSGAAWHRELLLQMEMQVPKVRPAVIRSTTRVALEEYLRFRHIVRNIYTWDFEIPRMKDLIDHLPQTLRDLEADLERFREFLDAAGRADEQE